MSNNYSLLLSPFKIGGTVIKNRFAVAPMGMPAGFDDSTGAWNERGIEYYVSRARGGWGLIYTGGIMTDLEVDPFNPELTPPPLYRPSIFKRTSMDLNDRIHAYGAKIFAQISMGLGRNHGLKSPSPLPSYYEPDMITEQLTVEEIKKKIEQVVKSAVLMRESGFDGVDLHAIHWGYLMDQFAMSLTNRRTDEYGGSLENRIRVAREIIEGIKRECGKDFPVTVRLGLKTYIKGLFQPSLDGSDEAGRTLEEGIRIATMLESFGCDGLSVDVGTYDSWYYASPTEFTERGFMLPLAEAAKKAVSIPIICGGGRLDDANMLEEAIAQGRIDAVALGRASLADPELPKKVAMGDIESIRPCIMCGSACMDRAHRGGASCCAVNPAAVREGIYGIGRAPAPKRVIVVGGGAAGMEAARTAALRGHTVELFEKRGALGGCLIPAGAHSFKEELNRLDRWYRQELERLNVQVQLNTEMTVERIRSARPDSVILATGYEPIIPDIPGIDRSNVLLCGDAICGNGTLGDKVAVIGGGQVGIEAAIGFAMDGREVTVIETADTILSAGSSIVISCRMMLKEQIEKYGITVRTGCTLAEIGDGGIVVKNSMKGGEPEEIAVDTVVLAIGYRAVPSMESRLYGLGIEVYSIASDRGMGNVHSAVWSGYEIAREI